MATNPLIAALKAAGATSGTLKDKLAVAQQAGAAAKDANAQALAEQEAAYYASPEGKLAKQILAQGTTSKWSGQGFGSAEANAKDMAKILSGIGITDIRQFGEIKRTIPGGAPIYSEPTIIGYSNDESSQPIYGGGGELLGYEPDQIVTEFGNKLTGQVVPNTYSERQTGNAWGGTFAGEGNTGYRVQFGPDGTPYFYTTGASSNDLANLMQDLGPAFQIGLAIATGGLSIPQQIAAQFAVQVLSGADIEDAIKGAAISYAVAQIPGLDAVKEGTSYLNGIDPSGVLSKSFQTAATSATKAAITGKDISEALLSGAVSGGISGAVDFMAKGIDGFENLTKTQQAAVKTAMTSVISGKPLDQVLINSAIAAANTEIATAKNNEAAQNAGWSDYATQQAAKALYGDKVTPSLYADKQETTEAEAKQIAKDILGREPSEFEYMQLIGLPEAEASKNSDLSAIKYDESTFDSNELAEAYKAVYGKAPTAEWLASDEAMDMLGRSDAQGKNMLQEVYTKDKNWVTEDEAKQFWKDMGNTGPAPQEFLDGMLMTTENGAKAMAETYRINAEDIAATTFDGSQYATPQEAAAAAKAAGFNAFTHKDKNLTYFTQPSPIEEANIRADVEEKKTFSEAFAAARKELGAGKTFTWNGKQYTTNVMPKDTFDASRSSTITTAATLALANGKDKFIGPDGKTYKLDDNAKSVLANSVNESPAETQRLLRQAIKPATDETSAETQRLMESGTRGTMDTIGAMTAQALGTTQRGLGNFLSNAGKTYAAMTGDLDFDNAAIRLGKEIETYAKGSDIYGLDVQKNRLSQAMARANETDNWIEKTKILGSAIGKNSLGFFDVAGSEVVEELPETVLQIGAALMTGGTTLAAKGVVAAIGAAGSVMETFGSTVEETYDKAKKAGFSNSEAMDKAYLNGVLSTAIEAGTNFVADKAMLAPFLNKFTGTLAGTATGFVSSTAIGAASELAAGLSQSYATQYMIDPKTASLSKAATDGIFEMFIGGTAQGTMGLPGYAIQGGAIIGKDYSGKDVTMADVAAGAVLDSSTVNPNAAIATSDDGDPITLGGAMLQMPNYQFDMSTLKTYVPQVFNNDKLIVGKDELGNNVTYGELMGKTTKSMDFDTLYKNLLNTTPEQSKEAQTKLITDTFKASGYTPSAAEINALIAAKPTGTTAIKDSVSTYVAPRQVTEAEAKKFFADIGYKPTDAEVKQFVKSGGNVSEAAVKADVAKYVAPLQVTDADARKFFADIGYKPTDAEVKQFVKQAKDADVLKEVYSYVDPRQVTKAEAEKFFADLGYKPTKAEIDSYIKQGNANTQAELVAEVAKYVAPRIVTEQEAKDAYAALGLKNPTKADIDKLVGQYDQTGLAGKATENLDAARYNSIIDQLGSITSVTPADVTTAISDYMKANPGLSKTDVATAISTYMKDNPGLTKTDLSTAISTATKDFATKKDIETAISNIKFPAGISKDDVKTAISDYMKANPGLSLKDVADKITEATKGLATTEGTKTAISDALKGYATTQDIKDAIAGIEFPASLSKDDVASAIKTYMEANPGLSIEDVASEIGEATRGLATTEGTKTAISDALKGYATSKDIETAIAGIKFPAGITKEDVADEIKKAMDANPGLSAADVTKSITDYMTANPGLTPADLDTAISAATKDLATTKQVGDVQTDVDALEKLIGTAGGKNAAGTGIIGQLEAMGLTDSQILEVIGAPATKTTPATGLYKAADDAAARGEDAAASVQKELSGLIGAPSVKDDPATLNIDESKAATGLYGQIEAGSTASQNAIKDVRDLIGEPGKDNVLGTGIIGQLEAMGLADADIKKVIGDPATKNSAATGLYKAAEDAAVRGENAASTVQKELTKIIGAPSVKDDPNTPNINEALAATGLYGQLESSQKETTGAIDTLSKDVQDKYNTLTDGQKDLADAMAEMGLDFASAIDLAAKQTQEQISGLGEQVDARIDELMKQGDTYQKATQKAIGELNTQNKQLQDLVGTQGRTATQADIDAMSEMLGGKREMDLTYDVTGDKQITQADIDFLTGVVGGTNTDWRAPVGSVFGPTGLYGQLATNEAQRLKDLQDQRDREEAANIQNLRTQGQQGVRSVIQQLQDVQTAGMTPQQAQVVEAGPGFDISDALNTGFFSGFQAKKAQQNQPQTTKIATGGYIDDLLAEGMSVDDLLNLLR